MQEAAKRLGLNHPQVLLFSQELDKLHTSLMLKNSKSKQVG
ncbi:aspartyl-phosphate phosphatase Spo0E family protein [Alkalicoccobacillus porphyridii]|uniref:Aspartyl-phosphate phosphatase Spo0E family protein n=2 Tax=Alkalicoccobacillus porphyridii TaxID=2597270 RepID=A0A554A4I8_9BACI|nr:aspartyl-phosphate phosphatase Spo0E family protein [Alkalicoccobacillus porphyridii]